MLERLHKVLARAGVAALRPAEDMIMAGRVTVNGRVVRELGARVDPETDVVAVDGQLVEVPKPDDPNHYVVLYKPVGVISTAYDAHDRPTVVGLVPHSARLFPVGRLDADSEGLLLLTDDGDLAFRLTHPRFEVEKEYRVLLDRTPTTDDLRRWREGVELDGQLTMPAWVEVLERTADGTWVRVVMREGRNRQIRNVARLLGYEVGRLIRVREGPLTLDELAPGQWRELSANEVQTLRAHTQHIPSRAAEEERERRMSERDSSQGRRLRVIRGSRRPEDDPTPRAADASSAAQPQAAAAAQRRARAYDQPAGMNEPRSEQTNSRPANAQRARPPYAANVRQQQSPQQGRNSHAEQARRQPRAPESRSDEYGRRNRDVGYRSNNAPGQRQQFNDRGPRRPDDRYDQGRGGGRDVQRPSDAQRAERGNERGSQRYANDRRGPAPNREDSYGNRRDFGGDRQQNARPFDRGRGDSEQRPYGQRGGQRSGGPSRDSGQYNERPRPYGERSFNDRRPGNERPRPYGERSYDERRPDREERGRPGSPNSSDRDERRDRGARPSDAQRGRGGYGRPQEPGRGPSDRPYNSRGPQRSANTTGPRGYSGGRREDERDAPRRDGIRGGLGQRRPGVGRPPSFDRGRPGGSRSGEQRRAGPGGNFERSGPSNSGRQGGPNRGGPSGGFNRGGASGSRPGPPRRSSEGNRPAGPGSRTPGARRPNSGFGSRGPGQREQGRRRDDEE